MLCTGELMGNCVSKEPEAIAICIVLLFFFEEEKNKIKVMSNNAPYDTQTFRHSANKFV